MAVVEDGESHPAEYRTFTIRGWKNRDMKLHPYMGVKEKGDDFAKRNKRPNEWTVLVRNTGRIRFWIFWRSVG